MTRTVIWRKFVLVHPSCFKVLAISPAHTHTKLHIRQRRTFSRLAEPFSGQRVLLGTATSLDHSGNDDDDDCESDEAAKQYDGGDGFRIGRFCFTPKLVS